MDRWNERLYYKEKEDMELQPMHFIPGIMQGTGRKKELEHSYVGSKEINILQ